MNRLLKVVGGAWIVCILGVFAPNPVLAQLRLTVNSTGDTAGFPSRTGICETAPGNGVCTLRAAIQMSNAIAGSDSISFRIPTTDPGYNPTTGAWRITLTSALPSLSEGVSISGPGATKLTIGPSLPSGSYRVFNVTATGTVTFAGLTIVNGKAPPAEGGGGIQKMNSGTLNIQGCTFMRNGPGQGEDGRGGAIYIAGSFATVNVTNSTFKFNVAATGESANQRGGAIFVSGGDLNVSDSTFSYNTVYGSGGAINNFGGLVTIERSTFRGNGAAGFGGAIENSSILNVANSTFYENIAYSVTVNGARGQGGAIFTSGTLNLTNSTVAANFAGFVASGVQNHLGTANIQSSIIAENRAGISDGEIGPDVRGSFTSQGFNLIGKRDGSTGFTASTDKKGTIVSPLSPRFDTKGLRNNGGPTETIALQSGSPAIDKGTSLGLNGILSTDQRGGTFLRKVDKATSNATGGDGTDIGAYEVQ